MRNREVSWQAWAVLAVGLAVASRTEAQQGPLRLTIASEKASYLVAEPVFIRIVLKNTGGTPVAVSPELALETELTSLFIAPPGQEFERLFTGIVEEPSKPLRRLAPSESIEHEQLVLYEWRDKDFAFPAPGRYRLKAVHHGFGERPDVESNVLEVEVHAPSGAAGEAVRLFRRQDVAALILNIDEPPLAVQSLETLMTQHRGTEYADYAQFYLARREAQEFFSRQPNPERAIQLFQELVSRRPSFLLADKAYLKMGSLYLQLGNRGKAEASLQKALTLAPDQEVKDAAQRLLRKMEVGGKP